MNKLTRTLIIIITSLQVNRSRTIDREPLPGVRLQNSVCAWREVIFICTKILKV